MRITKHSHPELWKITELSPASHLVGVSVDDAKYAEFRREADSIYPHLSDREKEIAALHLALTHKGFHGEPSAQHAEEKLRSVDRLHTRLILGAILLLLAILFLVLRARAQKDVPTAIVPLDDVAKVRVLSLLREQDKLIIRRRDDQLEIVDLDKRISDLQNQITQVAQEMAASGKINPELMVLDLDRLAWIRKAIPSEKSK